MHITIRAAGLLAAVVAVALATTSARSQVGPQAGHPEYVDPRVYSAAEAVRGLADPQTLALPGQFAFVVKGGGRDAERVFLNSEFDYRDAATLTVALSGPAVTALTQRLEGPPDRLLIGRTIVVNGVAQRVRINLYKDGQPTGEFYFQTHVSVRQADQIHVVPGPALPITVSR